MTRGGVNANFDLNAYNSTTGVHGAIVLGAPISQLISEAQPEHHCKELRLAVETGFLPEPDAN